MINPFARDDKNGLVSLPKFPIQPPKEKNPLDFGKKDFPKFFPHG
jgi:hypothetical protein